MIIKTKQLLTVLFLSLGIAACGAKEDGTKKVKGTLVVPKSSQKVLTKALKKADGIQFKKECPDVPAGYLPLKNIKVEFVDASSNSLEDTKTNKCGEFSAKVPNNVVKVKAESIGNKELIVDVSVFQSTGSTALASTIPSGAEYQISSIQMTAVDKVAFSVTDTITNNAVLGIPVSAISAKINVTETSVLDLSNAAHVSDPASITLVMDASGSMAHYKNNVRDKDGYLIKDKDGQEYSRFRMAALAAHTYLNNMPATDETGIVIFDEDVSFINDQFIADSFVLNDANGDHAKYEFSKTGYSSDAKKLRFLIDAYNPYSAIYSDIFAISHEKLHKDTPNLKNANYPWVGNTAVYDGIMLGLEKTKARENSRKVIIVMTDGENNRGLSTEASVIRSALDKSIPVYTIAFGTNSSANKSMKNIAESTNASFFKVTGTDLVSAFQSIQTGITFQYLVSLGEKVESGEVVTLTLHYNGETATREVTRLLK